MAKGLLTVDNIVLLGVAGGGVAYFTDFQGAKGIIDGYIQQLMSALKLGGGGTGGNGNGGVDCTANPTDPSCTGGNGGGGGGGDACAGCTTACCNCKCKDRTACPEGQCCDQCKDECPNQCGGAATTASIADTFPDNMDTIIEPQPLEELGPSGLGPITLGGYNYPNNNAFNDDDFVPVETSVSGYKGLMSQYYLPIPRSDTTFHCRETSRKDFDRIRYRFG